MIILDTNVLSEALSPAPSDSVMNWLGAQDRLAVFVTAITQAELLYGIEILPAGKRRSLLSTAVKQIFSDEFPGRILPFDEEAADVYAGIVAKRVRMGRPISQFDAMIAAIASSRGGGVATRNVRDFEHCGIEVLNPWAG
ncbi:MAG TPA: type II toxin-antitoxin system VapC family toxin [Bryobacteraceae bacterium]